MEMRLIQTFASYSGSWKHLFVFKPSQMDGLLQCCGKMRFNAGALACAMVRLFSNHGMYNRNLIFNLTNASF